MSTKKRSKSLILILSMLFILAGLNLAPRSEAKTLKFGHFAEDDSPTGKAAQRFARIVSQRTGGQIEVELYPRNQLGHPRSLLKELQHGRVDLTLSPIIYLRPYSPKMDILKLPFLFRNYQEVDRIFRVKNTINQQLLEDLEQVNIKGLAFWEIGFHNLSTSRRPIKGPWDLKGLKIGTYSNKALIQAFKILGAYPVEVPYGQLYEALQRGVVDGQEGSIDIFYRSRLYETQRYLSYTRHLYTALVLVMNSQTFRELSKRLQGFIEEAAFEAADYGRDLSRKSENEKSDRLQGMDVQIERQPDWDGFRKRVFYEIQEKFVREDGRKLLKEIEYILH